MKLLKKWYPALVAAVILVSPFVMTSYYSIRLLTTAGIYLIVVMGLNILLGYTGLVSIGQAGIYGVSAYMAGLLIRDVGLSFWIAMLISLVFGALLGLVIGAITLKLESAYLAIVTLGLALMIQSVLQNWRSLTGGFEGLLKIPKPVLFGFPIKSSTAVLFLVLVFDVLIFFLLRNLLKSKYGRNLKAVRDNAIASSMMGIDVVRTRLMAFTISSVLAALAGCIYAGVYGALFPDYFSMDLSVLFLCIVVLGGMGTVIGPIIGTILVLYGKEFLNALGEGQMLMYGLVIVAICVLQPGGLTELFADWWHKARQALTEKRGGSSHV